MHLSVEQQRFLTLYPPRLWIMDAQCPLATCRERMWVDVLAEDATCPYGHRWTLKALNDWKQTHPGHQRRVRHVPTALQVFYGADADVPCPACGARLQWRPDDTEGYCRCGAVWRVDQVGDRAAQRVMQEAPNGARPYHKLRK